MAEQRVHGTIIKTNGPSRKEAPQAPRSRVLWYRILMSHADGQVQYRAGSAASPNYRGIESPNRAEELARRGLISGVAEDLQAIGLAPLTDSPTVAVTNVEIDRARAALDAARQSTWKPGDKAKKRKAKPEPEPADEDE